jgi:hypothetical protein
MSRKVLEKICTICRKKVGSDVDSLGAGVLSAIYEEGSTCDFVDVRPDGKSRIVTIRSKGIDYEINCDNGAFITRRVQAN